MALCTATPNHFQCSAVSGGTCTTWGNQTIVVVQAGEPTTCAGPVLLSSTEYKDFLSASSAFGWDEAAFEVAFGGVLLLFAIGVGVGLIINIIRRGRTL